MDVATLIPIETNRNIPELAPGDTVRVSVKVVEGTRERIQVFEGVVIRVRKGTVNANFTVRRIASHSVGVERTFFLHSPRVDKVEVVRHGVVRRAKLYYLRGRTGRAARLRERRIAPGKRAAQVAAEALKEQMAAAEAAAAEAAAAATAAAEAAATEAAAAEAAAAEATAAEAAAAEAAAAEAAAAEATAAEAAAAEEAEAVEAPTSEATEETEAAAPAEATAEPEATATEEAPADAAKDEPKP